MSSPRLTQDDMSRLSSGSSMTGSAGQTAGGTDRDVNIPGAAPRGGAEYGADRPNFGSARSDYGGHAYGGTLDATGTGGAGVDDFTMGRVDRGSRGYGTINRRSPRGLLYAGGSSASGGISLLSLLAGIGIGAGLMYLLDPERGRSRRAYVRDQLVSTANKAGDQFGKTSRDLRNRAQGIVAESRSAVSQAGGAATEAVGSLGAPQGGSTQSSPGSGSGQMTGSV